MTLYLEALMSKNQTQSTIQLAAFAMRELPNDVLSIYFTANESGDDPNKVQEKLRKKLADALAVVRPLLKEGAVETETQSFSVSPRYNNKSIITGYYGSTALTVKGTDTATISELASQIKSMVVAGTGNSLSRAIRKSVEEEITAEAIAAFMDKANAAIASFDIFDDWKIGQVNISVERDYGERGARAMRAAVSLDAGGGASLEVESGKTAVNATVSGTIVVD